MLSFRVGMKEVTIMPCLKVQLVVVIKGSFPFSTPMHPKLVQELFCGQMLQLSSQDSERF